MVLAGTGEIISAAVLGGFGQPANDESESGQLAACPPPLARGGHENCLEHGIDVAGTDVLECNDDKPPPDCVLVECQERACSPKIGRASCRERVMTHGVAVS